MLQAYAKYVPWRFHRNERATNAGRRSFFLEISYRLKESECAPVSNLLIMSTPPAVVSLHRVPVAEFHDRIPRLPLALVLMCAATSRECRRLDAELSRARMQVATQRCHDLPTLCLTSARPLP